MKETLERVLTRLLITVIRAVFVAWALDYLRPQIPWLPHLTWIATFVALGVLGSVTGELVDDVLERVRA